MRTVTELEDEVRKNPNNQGLNESEMWDKIDLAKKEATDLNPNQNPVDQHGE